MLKLKFFSIVLLFCSTQCLASITIATIDWCPFICPNNSEKPGLLVEYTKAIYADSGKQLNFVVYPWSRAIKMTNEGKVDALLSPAKNEAPHLLYPQQEIGLQQFCFFSRTEDPWDYQNLDSMNGRTIIYATDALPQIIKDADHKAIMVGYPYNDAYMPRATDILLKGRIDSFMMTSHSVLHFLSQNDLKSRIRLSGCVHQQKLYLAFSPAKNLSDKIQPLINLFDENISRLKADAYFDKLLQKYDMK